MSLPTLNDVEARVLGVLVEKSFTTPDQYPLSLNSIRLGCNQKSNRAPVTSYVEAEVVVGLQGLVLEHLAGKVVQAGSRVEKFRHTAKEGLRVEDGELAVLAELLMRGPQSKGELRARVHRMVPTPTLPELQARLDALAEKGMVKEVPPAAGSRAPRYAQLLSPGLHDTEAASADAPDPADPPAAVPSDEPSKPTGLEDRVTAVERELAELRATVQGLIEELT